MEHIVNTFIPIFILILLGYFFKRVSFPSIDFWFMVDKFTYYVLMPVLLVYKLTISHINLGQAFNLVATVFIAILILFFSLIILNFFVKFNNKAFTSIVQGGIRFNSYIFLALISSLYEDEKIILAAIIMLFVIPFINIICISTFTIFIRNGKFSLINFLKTIIKNPLIIACLIGATINLSGITPFVIVTNSLMILSNAALPIGLLAVGFSLEFKYLKQVKIELLTSTLAKLVYLPIVTYGVALMIGLEKEMLAVAIIFASMPTAISGSILARELGGDIALIASIITVQTIVCMATLFFIIPII